MDSAGLIFEDIRTLLDLLKHCFVSPAQYTDVLLERPPRPAMEGKKTISTGNSGPSDSNTNYLRSRATNYTAYYGRLPFPNTPFQAVLAPPFRGKGIPPIFPLYLIFLPYYRIQVRSPYGCLVPTALLLSFRKQSSPRFQEL